MLTHTANGEMPQQLGDFLASRTRPIASKQEGDPAEAIAHLKAIDPRGRHNLVAMDADKPWMIEGRTFKPGAWAEMETWIAERNGRSNLYFSVNEPNLSAGHKKLSDADIGAIRCICADVDPRAWLPVEDERRRLRTLADEMRTGPIPPLVIDSGGGMQFFWCLPEKLDVERHASEARAHGRGIAKAIGGDGVHDIARVMRLPGTINIPGEKKRARGRERALAVRYAVNDKAFHLADLARVYPPVFSTESKDNDADIERVRSSLDMTAIGSTVSISDLDKDVRVRFEKLLSTDPRFRRLWDGDPGVLGKDKSGSAYRAALAMELNRAGGFTAETFGRLLFLWDHSVAAGADAHETITDRMIARDWVRIGLPKSADTWLKPIAEEPGASNKTSAPWETVAIQEAARTALAGSSCPLVKGILDRGALSVLYGESNVGKTFVALDIAFHVSTGLPWAGMRTTRRAVLYVAAEGGPAARKRCLALEQKFGAVFAKAHLQLRLQSVDLLNPSADLEQLIEAVKASAEPIGLIVVDTLSRAMAGGDENASTDMGALVKHLDRIRSATGAHVMAVHHSGKDRARGARGHSLLRAATDTEIEIAEKLITVTKQRDLDGSFKCAFDLEVMQLGTDQDGDPVTSCTVRLLSERQAEPIKPTAAEDAVLQALLVAVSTAEKPETGVTPKAIIECMPSDSETPAPNAVRTLLGRLAQKHHVRVVKTGFWALKAQRCAWLEPVAESALPNDIQMAPATKRNIDVFA